MKEEIDPLIYGWHNLAQAMFGSDGHTERMRVRRWAEAFDDFPGGRAGRTWCVRRSDLDTWMRRHFPAGADMEAA